ncbi:MAG: hypothetical protein U1F77_18035 [Kiritimatiellia bacterium]
MKSGPWNRSAMPETWGTIKTAAKIGVRRFAAWRKKSGVHPVRTGAHTAYFFFFAAAFLAAGFLAAVFFAAAFFLAAMCISLLSMFGCSVFFSDRPRITRRRTEVRIGEASGFVPAGSGAFDSLFFLTRRIGPGWTHRQKDCGTGSGKKSSA